MKDFILKVEARKAELEKQRKESVLAIHVAEDQKVAYFRKPNRREVSYAMTLLANDPLAAYEAVLNSCYLEGDRELLDNDEYFIGIAPLANSLISTKTAEVLK